MITVASSWDEEAVILIERVTSELSSLIFRVTGLKPTKETESIKLSAGKAEKRKLPVESDNKDLEKPESVALFNLTVAPCNGDLFC